MEGDDYMRSNYDDLAIDGNCEYAECIDGEHICRINGIRCIHLDENGVPSTFRCNIKYNHRKPKMKNVVMT